MKHTAFALTGSTSVRLGLAILVVLGMSWNRGHAKEQYRRAFFEVYASAVNSTVATVPSQPNHCGACHYDFTGGGTRNPHGILMGNTFSQFSKDDVGRSNAVWSVRNQDPDQDGYSTWVEMTDTTSFGNTPTSPGLTVANYTQARNVTLSQIADHLTPTVGGDTTPPDVEVTYPPDEGVQLTANAATTIEWTATDASGVASVDIFLSLDNGVTFDPLAFGLANTGSYIWFPANRPTTLARIRVEAVDTELNRGWDLSDSFSIVSPTNALVGTTLRDFDLPGTQPLETALTLEDPASCSACHGNYNQAVEPYFNWEGSMMAHASRDLLFEANMTISNQDAAESGDLCLRCHLSRGWLQGRSTPTDGSRMVPKDMMGVSCDLCHRLVDPEPNPGVNPAVDTDILAALKIAPTDFGNAMMVVDPAGNRRGPFNDPVAPHAILVSPFHQESGICATCHDVSNPAFEKNPDGTYSPNAFDTPPSDTSPHTLLAVERTYSEWFHSAYNTAAGVYAPQFAGNKPGGMVASCQDCHMRDVEGAGCAFPSSPVRPNLPLHDMTGGSTWLPSLLPTLYPDEVNAAAIQAGVERATFMLENAADLSVALQGSQLKVTVVNQTGHKLPTGYPEGRRMWLNVKFYDQANALLGESGAYDPDTGVLAHGPTDKIYEVKPGISTNLAQALGLEPGPSFHFVLNDTVYKDNRIPPRGFTNSLFASFGGAPVAHTYEDGQHWDDTFYDLPPGTTRAEVRLYYQSTSKEFVEFLRDENDTNTKGDELFALWNDNGKCPPTLMAESGWTLPLFVPQGMEYTADGKFQMQFLSQPGVTYTIEYTDELTANPVWRTFQNHGTLTATNTQSMFEDDFTSNTSGAAPATGQRFYRFQY